MRFKQLYQEAGQALHAARALQDQWQGKEMPADIDAQINALLDEAEQKSDAAQADEKRAGRFDSLDSTLHTPDAGSRLPTPVAADMPTAAQAQAKAFMKALAVGINGLDATERKDLQTTNLAGGGYLVAPQQWVANLVKFVDDQVFVRGLATKYTVGAAESLGYPSLEADPADADWTGEITSASADSSLAFGKRELKPSPLSKLVKISRPLIAKVPDVDGLIQRRLAYKFGITEEKAFLTGTGANQPLGVFTASTQGISTARDVTMAGATAITMDDLINTKYSIKAAYWPKAAWILHRDVVKLVRKLKDTAGYYIWQPATMPGTPATLLEAPLYISEYAPNTVTSGLYTGIYGDFSHYVIADSLDFNIQVLTELYALTNQNGYVARAEVDGMPDLEEAFARMKQA